MAELVVRWAESNRGAPIVSLQLASAQLFDQAQRARLRAALGERLVVSADDAQTRNLRVG